MSSATLFRPGGDPYAGIPLIAFRQLDPFWRTAAVEVLSFLVTKEREDGLDERITDQVIAQALNRCESFVQKGLFALEHFLGEAGRAIIKRNRAHGRRTIEFVRGLAPSRTRPAPPAPPEDNRFETTSTAPELSSSSDVSKPGEDQGPDPALVAALHDRARRLVDGVSPGDIADAIRVFTAEWVGKALDVVERRNRKPGNLRKGWGYVLGILLNRQKKGDWPEDPPKAAAATPKPAVPDPAEAEDKAREQRLRDAWGLLAEPEREAIRATVRAENPVLVRFKAMFDAACLGELERRQAAEEPRAP